MATKLTPELIKNMAAEIADGLPVCYTCDLFGVVEASYHNWMRQGQEDYEQDKETIHAQLFSEIKKSYAQYVNTSKKRIHSGTPGWQGTAWWLERTNSFFMPKQQITPDEDGKVNVIIGGKVKDIQKK